MAANNLKLIPFKVVKIFQAIYFSLPRCESGIDLLIELPQDGKSK